MDDRGSVERLSRLTLSDPHKEDLHGVGDVLSGDIVKGAGRPRNAVVRRRPNPEDRLPGGEGKTPSTHEAWHRRTYDMNKELAEDLRRGMTIKIGCDTVGIAGNLLVGNRKKRFGDPN